MHTKNVHHWKIQIKKTLGVYLLHLECLSLRKHTTTTKRNVKKREPLDTAGGGGNVSKSSDRGTQCGSSSKTST